jgi:hypothetical protein
VQRRVPRRVLLSWLPAAAFAACGGRSSAPAATPTPLPTLPTGTTPLAPATALPTNTATPSPSPPPTAIATAAVDALLPVGFPIDPRTRLGMVTGAVGARTIAWDAGPAAEEYSRADQPSGDPERANRCGWNARLHVEYEGQPAVDWYVRGAPVTATMDGTATLLINTVANPFDVYGVPREAYIGNPDRSRAPISPFPGPGGGQGVFVRIENAAYRTDSAHLELAPTLAHIPKDAWVAGFAADAGALSRQFAALRDFRTATAVARWSVKRGDVIGVTGDTGYSEAPHLHYAIRPAGQENALCPTREVGFSRSGWLFGAPG